MESYTVKPLHEDQITKEPTEEIQVHLMTTFLLFFLIGNSYFCPSTSSSSNSWHLEVFPALMREVDSDRA